MEVLSVEWLTALSVIVFVDLLLAGDNAIVIALAARNLPVHWQKKAIIYGTLGAIIVRVVLVVVLTNLLQLAGLGIIGGSILYVIAWRLLGESPTQSTDKPAAQHIWSAMATIIVADTVMGLDNVLAIAGAAQGDVWLIIIGLGLSIPVMMAGSALILKFFEKIPGLVVVGSGVLSLIAGRIILDDKWLSDYLGWSVFVERSVILAIATILTVLAWYLARLKQRRAAVKVNS